MICDSTQCPPRTGNFVPIKITNKIQRHHKFKTQQFLFRDTNFENYEWET